MVTVSLFQLRCLFEKNDNGEICQFFNYYDSESESECRLNHGLAAQSLSARDLETTWETWLPVDISVTNNNNDYFQAMTDFNDVEYKGKKFFTSFNKS